MCSILGGSKLDEFALQVYHRAKDRGRDYTGLSQYGDYWIANHRAAPTNEVENPIENQPFGKGVKIVHNGTIANDKEHGLEQGHIDSKILEKLLDTTDVDTVAASLKNVRGSYAIAILKPNEIIVACNYKPIFYLEQDGEFYFSSLKWHLGENALRVPAYSVLNLKTKQRSDIARYQPNKALVVCSGGLDSTAVAGYAAKTHSGIRLLHFDYGCKASAKELQAIVSIAAALKCDYEVLTIDYSKFKGNSTLFKAEDVNSGEMGVEYALDWVYARNLILLSMAVGYAEANDFGYIYLGTNLEEAGAYPDNEEQFILDFNNLLWGAVNNGFKLEVRTPLGGLMKREIVEFGIKHDSPLHLSWSCYNGGEEHCGECGPCYMRRKAFERAGIEDKTTYKNQIK